MITMRSIPCLDLAQIAASGQCFRMTPLPPEALPAHAEQGFSLISRGQYLRIWQNREDIFFDCPEEELPFWLYYFDTETDYPALLRRIDPADAYLTEAACFGRGIRILRQDPWEMIITFVISQQKTIPAIRRLTEALCRRCGTELAQAPGCFAFPTPEQLASLSLAQLQEMKLGYRAKYIARLSREAAEGTIDLALLSQLDNASAMDYLTQLYGIGKKVASCVCLFGLHQLDAFPVDTWIQRILMEHYYDAKKYRRVPKADLCDRMIRDHFSQYQGCAGILQQYLFFYERSRSQNAQE